MGNEYSDKNAPAQPSTSLEQQIRAAAYQAWMASREDWQERSEALFERVYLGHYASVDHYVETLVDGYQLDTKLDAVIAEPFRRFVDIDITGLARALVENGSLHTLAATPLGVWVFNGDIA